MATAARPIVVAVALGGALLGGCAGSDGTTGGATAGSTTPAATTRQQAVAAQGSHVMPFDLERTTHAFTDRPDGGVEEVRTRDLADTANRDLIRSHLQHEAELFRQGDFADPQHIHGDAMPGVAELAAAARAGTLTVAFETLPDGARLTYRSTDPAVVDAVHRWFTAQRTDHGTG